VTPPAAYWRRAFRTCAGERWRLPGMLPGYRIGRCPGPPRGEGSGQWPAQARRVRRARLLRSPRARGRVSAGGAGCRALQKWPGRTGSSASGRHARRAKAHRPHITLSCGQSAGLTAMRTAGDEPLDGWFMTGSSGVCRGGRRSDRGVHYKCNRAIAFVSGPLLWVPVRMA
jgi:hypothetical protein